MEEEYKIWNLHIVWDNGQSESLYGLTKQDAFQTKNQMLHDYGDIIAYWELEGYNENQRY